MAIVSRPSRARPADAQTSRGGAPVVSGESVLRCLGIDRADLSDATVTVRTGALIQLLRELARQQLFDPEFYAENNPDIEAARLAGIVTDLHAHYIESGFLEGRLPFEPPFDPEFYVAHYPDLVDAIPPDDVAGLRNHFLSAGLAEGRAGTEASLAQTARWAS